MDLCREWEDDRGGFKVKWRDDTSAWIVFADAAVAKRAFLSLLTSPPPSLLPPTSTRLHPSITAYTGEDVPQILQAVQNRPRSHSNAGLAHHGSHSRKGSLAGSGSLSNPNSGTVPTLASVASGGSGQTHHSRTASWGRNSLDRRAAKDLIDSSIGGRDMTASGLVSNPFASARDREREDGAASPEAFTQGHGGIVAGDTPRGIGRGQNGVHRRTGSESAGSRVAGSTIRE